jgi:hypothetical protein
MKNKATIIHHQGFGDLFTSNPLCMYYAKQFDELVVLVSTESRLKVVESMYRDFPNIKCQLANLTNSYSGVESCLNCMTLGKPDRCPRDGTKCIYIDYDNFQDYKNLKVGCFNDYRRWNSFLIRQMRSGSSFSHCFYDYDGISLKDRVDLFQISRDDSGDDLYKNLVSSIGSEYIVVHDDPNRNLSINNLKSDVPKYYLNLKSKNMIDQLKIIQQSKEIHLIDSSYSVLVYFLSFSNKKIKQIPKFLHTLGRRDRDIKIYENPIPDNWQLI